MTAAVEPVHQIGFRLKAGRWIPCPLKSAETMRTVDNRGHWCTRDTDGRWVLVDASEADHDPVKVHKWMRSRRDW